jgi:hypothetical protein
VHSCENNFNTGSWWNLFGILGDFDEPNPDRRVKIAWRVGREGAVLRPRARSVQLPVFRQGLFQDRDIRIGVLPECEELL